LNTALDQLATDPNRELLVELALDLLEATLGSVTRSRRDPADPRQHMYLGHFIEWIAASVLYRSTQIDAGNGVVLPGPLADRACGTCACPRPLEVPRYEEKSLPSGRQQR
jgi:hypothetical protein